jgi:guanine nucleotide-binding protein subunit alpha, other
LFYFFSSLDRLFDKKYVPVAEDILQCRVQTVGVTETTFEITFAVDVFKLIMIDVGGQKSARRKWLDCFQDVTVIGFVVDLSGYDLCMVEDKDAVGFSSVSY